MQGNFTQVGAEATQFTKPPFEVFEDHRDDPATLWGLLAVAGETTACAMLVEPALKDSLQQEP